MDEFKREAARRALTYVRSGMLLGLGSGSTMAYFITGLGERVRGGDLQDIVAVPTSEDAARHARDCDIPLTTLDEHPQLDLVMDGTDEVDPAGNLIKGRGRALLREKIVAVHASAFIVILDESKLVSQLGTRGPLPVEIVPFSVRAHVRWLNSLSCRAELWREEDGSPAITDNGNCLARCWFEGGIAEPQGLARTLSEQPGVVEHGLFLGMATKMIVAGRGGVRELEWPS